MSNLKAMQDPPRPQPILEVHLMSIDSRLKELYELDARIGSAIGRILNPRPADIAKEAEGVPVPATIEGKLQNIARTIDVIIGGFRDHADRLDSAI